jgi:hypothetical protein
METNAFVLSFAAFMVIVTLFYTVSQWDFRPAAKPVPAFACSVEGLCREGDCSAPLPQDFVIVPQAADGNAYLYRPADTYFPDRLEQSGSGEWALRNHDAGKVILRLRGTGALRITEYEGLGADSKVLSEASGTCRDVRHTSREPL